MKNIAVFNLNLAGMAFRFYLMMAAVIIFGFLGQFTIAAILGYALAISFILGVSFRKTTKKAVAKGESQLRKRVHERTIKKAA